MNYLALTIGPIVETLAESKKTKELFAGSYLFSYFMKELLLRLKASGYELIVPYHEDIDTLFKESNGIGIFHDRLMVSHAKEQELMAEDIENYIRTVIRNITQKTIDIDSNNAKHKDLIQNFWKKYFQISYVIREEFSLKELGNMLDVAELHREFIVSHDEYKVLEDQEGKMVNPLVYLQRKFHQSFLKIDALGEEEKKKFLSVLEIALDEEIAYKYDEIIDKKLEEEALKGKKNHKKYMALIQADGDKIGAILKTMDKEPDKIRLFSEKLLEFTKKIPNIAKKYNAKVVYAGGDDMLAFSPIITQNKETVFDFLKEIDDEFKQTLKELNMKEANSVSQSFGVSLVYYKKPLYQALSKAQKNLFDVAKSDENIRNRAVVELIKHSGKTSKTDMVLSGRIYESFNRLLKQELSEEDSSLPHAVTHNLARSKASIKALADEFKDENLLLMIDNFFKNNFNKEIHSDTQTNKALEEVKVLLLEHLKTYQSDKTENKEFDKYFDSFKSLVSMIKHLRGDR